jgi:hypothetical protein
MSGSRDINSATITASQASLTHPVLFLKLEFDGGDVNMHTELGDLTFGGDTYTGVGILGAVSSADEVSDLSLAQITVTLSGLPNDLVSIAFEQQYQGRLGTMFLGYLDLTTRTLVDTPAIIYRGIMDTMDFQQDASFSITLSIGNRFSAWNNPQIRRYNNADQQSRYPGDKGLQFIEQSSNKTIIWGAKK